MKIFYEWEKDDIHGGLCFSIMAHGRKCYYIVTISSFELNELEYNVHRLAEGVPVLQRVFKSSIVSFLNENKAVPETIYFEDRESNQ